MATSLSEVCAAAVIARFLAARGVDRVFALCGGHIMPVWMRIDAEGIGIVDVRDERAAVYMAHAYGELTGRLGVALVTAGPGVTNAMTGIANAHVARAPVLVLSGLPPRPQENRGALQDVAHTELVRSITRYARTVREPALVLQELDEAVARAFGQGGEPGPVYLDFPTDTLRADVPRAVQLDEHFRAKPAPSIPADQAQALAAARLLWSARRPLVISGRGARGASASLVRLLDRLGAAYLDTAESRGIVPDAHPSVAGAVRGSVMSEADVVLTVGRRLDFQLAYGSPAVFGDARFVRIADAASELRDNRRGDVEMLASCAAALDAIVAAAGESAPAVDHAWVQSLRDRHERRVIALRDSMRAAPHGADGYMHPNRLLACLQDRIGDDALVVADGGDFLSFARIGLRAATWLDPGLARLHRCRHAVWNRSRARVSRAHGRRCHGRRRVRIQRDGNRYRGAPPGAVADHRREQRRMADRSARSEGYARQGRRHEAAARRLRGDGARVRSARRAHRSRRGTAGSD